MIYVDLLVINDLILNYLILLGVSLLLNRVTNLKKIFLSAVIGTIPIIFLFTSLNQSIIFLISLIFSLIMSLITYQYKDILYTLKNIFYMHALSIFIAGAIYLINTKFFYNVDSYILNFLITISLSPIITYIYIKSINQIKTNYSNYYQAIIYLRDKPKITVSCYLDTGNKLKDPYKQRPIILLDKKLINTKDEKIILVPYNTIDNHSLLQCIKPEKIFINGVGYRRKLLIGLIDEVGIEGADCILNQKVLERI